mgnify:CR=1 FL=1
MPKTFGTIGVMQGGKTYYTVGHFLRSLAYPECLPFHLAHARTFNLVDVMNKINDPRTQLEGDLLFNSQSCSHNWLTLMRVL